MLFKDFFVNVSILVSFLFVYLQIVRHEPLSSASSFKRKVIAGLFSGALGNILMIFSIHVTGDIRSDLRHIPIIITMVYGGWIPAAISTAIISLGRFFYGVNAISYIALALMVFNFAGYYAINRKGYSLYKKVLFMLVHSNIVFSIIVSVLVPDWNVLKFLLPVYWGICLIGGAVSIYVMEYILRTQKLFKRFEQERCMDFLTRLGNVRFFDQTFNSMVEQSKMKGEELSLLYMDIDFFKKINDTYGHKEGDAVLKELGEILLNSTRTYDVVCRNGGEEFSVILPDTGYSKAMEVAERIRNAVEHNSFCLSDGVTIKVTVSIGVAHYPSENQETLLEKADKALYRAKTLGRNQVQAAH